MSPSFSWQNFDRMARVLGSLGYVVAVFGPLLGILMLIFSSTPVRIAGLVLIVGSILIALYHISFSLLMDAIRTLAPRDVVEGPRPGESAATK
jgi:hypothetical protein